jgi:hypothetical protein
MTPGLYIVGGGVFLIGLLFGVAALVIGEVQRRAGRETKNPTLSE